MSSHHIVRDEQEPALIIGQASSELHHHVQALLEWSPTIIVLENCLDDVLKWGIKIDMVVVQRNQHAEIMKNLADQQPIKLLTCENSDGQLLTALQFLTASKHEAVNIVTKTHSDFFSSLINWTSSLQIGVLDYGQKTDFYKDHFKKWLPSKSVLHIIATENEQHFDTSGLTKIYGVYINNHDQMVEIKSQSPFWVTQTL